MLRYIKYISLAVLSIQTTVYVLLLRYSRTVPTDGPRYLSSTTIFISEIIKLLTCLLVIYHNCGYSLSRLYDLLYHEVWKKPRENLKIFVPAFLYTIQNNLLFLALSNLDAATYQVTYQLKILVTAMFAVIILHKHLELSQWFALVLLMMGVALVQMPSDTGHKNIEHSISSQVLGLVAVLIACFSSAFSGVYFEKLVKNSSQSIWIRNIQLAYISVILSACAITIQDYDRVAAFGFFQGYNIITWTVILLQAFGGLVVATVVKYADNILKGFATSISIVSSTIFSYYLLNDFIPTKYFIVGASLVIVATVLYGCSFKMNFLSTSPGKSEQKNTS